MFRNGLFPVVFEGSPLENRHVGSIPITRSISKKPCKIRVLRAPFAGNGASYNIILQQVQGCLAWCKIVHACHEGTRSVGDRLAVRARPACNAAQSLLKNPLPLPRITPPRPA